MDESILPEEHYNAAKAEWALRELIGKYKLQGWCQHFVVLGSSPRIPLLPFLAASKLMSEGIAYSAEGDVCGAISGYIMNIVSGNSTLSEVFTVDYEKKSVLMKHMGEMNISMARKDSPVKVIRKKFALAKDKMNPPTPVFSLEPGVSTLLSLTASANGKLQFVAAEFGHQAFAVGGGVDVVVGADAGCEFDVALAFELVDVDDVAGNFVEDGKVDGFFGLLVEFFHVFAGVVGEDEVAFDNVAEGEVGEAEGVVAVVFLGEVLPGD
jgi:hypothetical protein